MKRVVPILVLVLGCWALTFLPGPKPLAAPAGATARATVVEVDDSGLQRHGLIEFGTQRLKVRLADGSVKEAHNELRAHPREVRHAIHDLLQIVHGAYYTILRNGDRDDALHFTRSLRIFEMSVLSRKPTKRVAPGPCAVVRTGSAVCAPLVQPMPHL